MGTTSWRARRTPSARALHGAVRTISVERSPTRTRRRDERTHRDRGQRPGGEARPPAGHQPPAPPARAGHGRRGDGRGRRAGRDAGTGRGHRGHRGRRGLGWVGRHRRRRRPGGGRHRDHPRGGEVGRDVEQQADRRSAPSCAPPAAPSSRTPCRPACRCRPSDRSRPAARRARPAPAGRRRPGPRRGRRRPRARARERRSPLGTPTPPQPPDHRPTRDGAAAGRPTTYLAGGPAALTTREPAPDHPRWAA